MVKTVETLRERCQLIVGLDTMDNIVKGGRLSKTAGKVGGMLSVRLTIRGQRWRDRSFPRNTRLQGCSRSTVSSGSTPRWAVPHAGMFCVMHALSLERAEWLREALEERYDVEEMHFVETGTVIATHTGTGWGVALLPLD